MTEIAKIEAAVRKMAHSFPPSDLGSHRAIQAVAAFVHNAVRAERSACLQIAASYGGRDADEIAEAIGKRSFRLSPAETE